MNADEIIRSGDAMMGRGRPVDAAREYRRALERDKTSALAWDRLGHAEHHSGRYAEAVAAFKRLVELVPANGAAHHNLASALAECGEIADSLQEYRAAIRLEPANGKIAGGMLYVCWFADDLKEDWVIREHQSWNRSFAEPLKTRWKPHANSRDPNRRLKIGYVSPHFRIHPVGRFMLPLLYEHDKNLFATHVYLAGGPFDAVTDRFKQWAGAWHDISQFSDDDAAEQIRRDGIDILIDLSMHMGHTMGIFARKPAPVQITYLAYVGTTGLEAIDWRITDPVLEPTPANFIEKPLIVPHYWCYKPSIWNVEPGPAPVQRNGHITFGSLNAFKKSGHVARELWAKVLLAVADSKMIVHASEGSHRQAFLGEMESLGVDPSRFTFVGVLPLDRHMRTYQSIDIALDTFPYTGGTTTCDALWMGVPVITLAGAMGVSRMGASILGTVGLRDLVADNPDEFAGLAVQWARDPVRISQLRQQMRDRLYNSPLTDAKQFAGNMEAAFRRAWVHYCGKDSGKNLSPSPSTAGGGGTGGPSERGTDRPSFNAFSAGLWPMILSRMLSYR
jgi:predicted O-linked N-acetylglucosamine transferase (SPINDLY family)